MGKIASAGVALLALFILAPGVFPALAQSGDPRDDPYRKAQSGPSGSRGNLSPAGNQDGSPSPRPSTGKGLADIVQPKPAPPTKDPFDKSSNPFHPAKSYDPANDPKTITTPSNVKPDDPYAKASAPASSAKSSRKAAKDENSPEVYNPKKDPSAPKTPDGYPKDPYAQAKGHSGQADNPYAPSKGKSSQHQGAHSSATSAHIPKTSAPKHTTGAYTPPKSSYTPAQISSAPAKSTYKPASSSAYKPQSGGYSPYSPSGYGSKNSSGRYKW